MKKLFPNLRIDKKMLFQFALVFAAFLMMVVIGSFFGARIVSRNLSSYGKEVMHSSSETIKAYLDEYKLTLEDIAFSIERLKNEGAELDVIHAELASWTEWILGRDQDFESFLSIYCVVDGVLIDGQYVEPPEGYVPQSRPWYIGALEKNGDTHYCDPYPDVRTGEIILTVSRLLYDENGQPFGVIALDVFMTTTANYVSDLRLMDSGYGMLLDPDRTIVVHPDESRVGMRLEEVNDGAGGYREIASRLALGQDVTALPYTAYTGTKSVAFFTQLFNGWYVGIISPSNVYYSDVVTMRLILSAAGFVLMVSLCTLLAFLHMEKNRSDEANQLKTSFLANMSHEIRTPMNAIIGMSELLLKEPLNSRQQGYVKDINTSSESLLSIINDILDLSKIEAGKLDLNPVDYDFLMFIDNIHSMFQFVTEKKGLTFQYETAGELPKCLNGDDIRLRQVLTNICGNAVKFTNQGFIRLKVTAADKTMTFEIQDSGMGIRKEDLPKLFEPFSQADALKNRTLVGTGLGLPISKSFVEMMGGKITVDSVYGQGTLFTITLPKVPGDENAIRYEEDEKKKESFYAPTAKVLVVDDNELNLKVASGLLNLFKIKAVTSMSGKDAIELIKSTDYDIVFMDHMMPEMDGIETTKEIRKLGSKYKKLTIIALTANAIRGAKEMFMENGLDGFISKPINVDELSEILRGLLPSEKIVRQTDTPPAETAQIEAAPTETSETEAGQIEEGFLASVEKLVGIDTQIGMSHVSNLEDMYIETLALFCKKLPSECAKMDGFLSGKDLHNLAISAHSMKASLSTVGAMALSEAAFALEKASKNEELSTCQEHLPAFLANLRGLHERLSTLFPDETAAPTRFPGNPDDLPEKVRAALNAADEFDSDAAIEIIDKLLKNDFGTQTNDLLETAKNALDDYDFSTAVDCMNKILES